MKKAGMLGWLLGFSLAQISVFLAPPQAYAANSFSFRLTGEPETLDWNRAHTPIETMLLMNLMEGLVSYDPGMKVIPALAKSWSISADGKVYTFKLRPDVKWSDGVSLKAQDFVYSWKRLLSPITAASYAYFLFDIEGAQEFNQGTLQNFGEVGVKALDDLTFQVRLKHPVAHWIHIPTFWVTFPLRADIVDKYGSSGWAVPGKMVTLGPFNWVSHDLDSKLVLKRNPTYYGTHGNIDEVVARIVTDDSTALNLYETGRLDFLTDISSLDLKRLSGRPDLKIFPYLRTGYMGFVVNKYPVSNVGLRRAIAMAIDKARLVEVLHGGQRPAASFVPPPMFSSSTKVGLPFNPDLAKAELRKAGIDPSHPPTVEILLGNWDKPQMVQQFIQAQIKQNLGLNISLQPFDNKTYRSQLDLGTYPVFDTTWSADYPDPDNFMSVFLSDSGNSRTHWKNSEYDRLIVEARSMGKQASREKAYLAAQKILLEKEAVIIPLYYEQISALVRPWIHGLTISPLNYLFLKNVNSSGH